MVKIRYYLIQKELCRNGLSQVSVFLTNLYAVHLRMFEIGCDT